jgi:hypothetical protein
VKRPSSLPALKECPQFDSTGTTSEHADAGTKRHKALEKLLAHNDPLPLQDLPEDERDGVTWAADYIRLHAPMSDHPLETERKRSFIAPDFSEISGTPDYVCGNHVFDLKWRYRDYSAQMAAYALMVMDSGHESVICHVLFGEPQKAYRFDFTRESAESIIGPILESAGKGDPTPCDYCSWCSKSKTCPALIARANAVVGGRDDWKLEQYHASCIEDTLEMGKALKLARQLADWCEAIEHHAKDMALKRGIVPAGFSLKSRQGNRFIKSVLEAFPKAGLPQDVFLAACEVKLSTLVEAYAGFHGSKKAPAERELEAKLGETVQRKPSSMALVADKEVKP